MTFSRATLWNAEVGEWRAFTCQGKWHRKASGPFHGTMWTGKCVIRNRRKLSRTVLEDKAVNERT